MENIQSTVLTGQLTVLLSMSLKQQRIQPIISADENGKILFLKINQSTSFDPDTSIYKNEKSMFGKAIRLLTYLEKRHQIRSFINSKGVNAVIVGERFDNVNATKKDVFILDAKSLNKVFSDLEMMGQTEALYELSVKFLIDQNQ